MSNINRRPADTLDAQIGQAWSLHFKKDYQKAISAFRPLVDEHPNHIDLNYGIGLSYAALQDRSAAGKHFNKALELVSEKVKTELSDEEFVRYTMLMRMIQQQIAKLG
jgi:Flp pilus assembly protein TadD